MTENTHLKPEFTRCYCTGVVRARIIEAILVQGCRSIEELQHVTGVCGGCGSCRPELADLLAKLLAELEPPAGSRPPLCPFDTANTADTAGESS